MTPNQTTTAAELAAELAVGQTDRSPTDLAINELQSALSLLDANSSHLVDRLAVVSTPDGPSNSSAACASEDPPAVPLISQINDFTRSVDAINNRLTHAAARLAI